MAKIHTKAPLPFTGQKRNFIRHFRQVLSDNIPGDGAGWTIVDAFGGSGLLSHTARHAKPAACIIYNDFDGYAQRLDAIADTNRLRRQLADILAATPRESLLSPAVKSAVLAAIHCFNGHVDIDAVASWLLFSGQQAESLDDLCRKHMYNSIRRSDYPAADGYLDGITVTSESYCTLLPKHINQPNTLLVLDPPYVCTKQGAYRLAGYFGMVAFLRLMGMVRPPFIFFSSTRSELPAYIDLVITERMQGWERLSGHNTITAKVTVNKGSRYEDNLIYKF